MITANTIQVVDGQVRVLEARLDLAMENLTGNSPLKGNHLYPNIGGLYVRPAVRQILMQGQHGYAWHNGTDQPTTNQPTSNLFFPGMNPRVLAPIYDALELIRTSPSVDHVISEERKAALLREAEGSIFSERNRGPLVEYLQSRISLYLDSAIHTSGLSSDFKEMKKSPHLTALHEAFYRTHDPLLFQILMAQYDALVKYVLKRKGSGVGPVMDSDDFLVAGREGLMEAVERYDPGRGIKFSTYAIPRIRGNMFDTARREHVLPRSMRIVMRKIEHAQTALQHELERVPTLEEIAERAGLPSRSILAVRRIWGEGLDNPRSLCEPVVDGEGDYSRGNSITLADMVADNDGEDALDGVVESERQTDIRTAIEEVGREDERVGKLLNLYYFANEGEGMSMIEIAKKLRLSESRVVRIHKRAILSLREKMVELGHRVDPTGIITRQVRIHR